MIGSVPAILAPGCVVQHHNAFFSTSNPSALRCKLAVDTPYAVPAPVPRDLLAPRNTRPARLCCGAAQREPRVPVLTHLCLCQHRVAWPRNVRRPCTRHLLTPRTKAQLWAILSPPLAALVRLLVSSVHSCGADAVPCAAQREASVAGGSTRGAPATLHTFARSTGAACC